MVAYRSFNREELYNLVWSEPMQKLAKRFEISDVGLAKACRRAHIPLPERGYWNKLAVGKKVEQRSLPPRFFGMYELVSIGQESADRRAITDEEILNTFPAEPLFPESLESVEDRARVTVGRITAAKDLSQPHPMIARLLADDERRRQKLLESPYATWHTPLFDTPHERRRLRILDSLFQALVRCGCSPWIRGKEGKELGSLIGDTHLSFTLEFEKQNRRDHSTQNEKANKSEGVLRLEITRHWDNKDDPARVWQDDGERKLESRLQEIVETMLVTAEIRHRFSMHRSYEWQIERRNDLIEEMEKRRLQVERQKREKMEREKQQRLDALLQEASRWRQAAEIRSYVAAAVEKSKHSTEDLGSQETREWASWALAEANRIDPLVRSQ